MYAHAIPALIAALESHLLEATNPLADLSHRPGLAASPLLELADVARFGNEAVGRLVDGKARQRMSGWLELLDRALAAAGGLDGSGAPSGTSVVRQHSARTYVYDPKPRRDERFPDPYNRGVNAEVFHP